MYVISQGSDFAATYGIAETEAYVLALMRF